MREAPFALALLAALISACGGDDDPTPTAPTPLTGHAEVAGEWAGTWAVSTDNIDGGGCLGELLRTVPQESMLDVVITVQQMDTMLTGQSVITEPDGRQMTCSVAGSVSEDRVEAMLEACSNAVTELGVIMGCGTEVWTMELGSATYVATVDGSRMNGTVTETRTVRGGEESHAATVTSELSLERQ